MATWIAHLRIAEILLDKIPGLDAAQFAIGNVAPDSGIPDEERNTFDPPVEVTHFQPAHPKSRDHRDLDFYRGYLRDLNPTADSLRFSFRLGYFFHLVTDNLWSQRVGRPTKEKFPEQFAADPNFIWTVKDNWYGLDFLHVRANPASLFWRVFLDSQPAEAELDFLPARALTQQLTYIKNYYRRADPEIQTMIDAPYIYLTAPEMDSFIEQTARDLHTIYSLLWNDHRDVSSFHTATLLLADSR
ncbi:MAG: hypothetical protein AB1750_15015 [Chloroflexota bacterium]